MKKMLLELQKILLQLGVLTGLLAAVLLLGGIFEGGLSLLSGLCMLAPVCASIRVCYGGFVRCAQRDAAVSCRTAAAAARSRVSSRAAKRTLGPAAPKRPHTTSRQKGLRVA